MYLCTYVHGLLEETVHEQCVSIIIFKSLGLPDGQEPTVSQYLHLIANDYPLLKLSTQGLQGDPLQRPAPHEVVFAISDYDAALPAQEDQGMMRSMQSVSVCMDCSFYSQLTNVIFHIQFKRHARLELLTPISTYIPYMQFFSHCHTQAQFLL